MELELTTVPFIILSVYIITQILKMTILKSDNQRKALPVVAAILGAAIALTLFFLMPETVCFDNVIAAATDGMASGFAAVGCNQVYKQFKKHKIVSDEDLLEE